jgi:outer membrane protein assembly factor BamB
LYVLDRANLGHFNSQGDSQIVQTLLVNAASYATPAFWQNTLYYFGANATGKAYTLNTTTDTFNVIAGSVTGISLGFPGATPSISSSGATNGIVWILDTHYYCTQQSGGCSAAVLHAFDATNVGTELWNSALAAGNAAGFAVKFTVPTVANGKVYVGTRGNDSGAGTSSILGALDVYGLKPN